MAMHRFVHIGFAFDGVPKMLDLEPVIATFGDWIRYSALSWIVWTDKPTGEMFTAICGHLDIKDNVLITKIDLLNSFGRMPPWIWNWINSKSNSTIIYHGNALQEVLKLPKP